MNINSNIPWSGSLSSYSADEITGLSEYVSEKPGEKCEGKTFSIPTGKTDTDGNAIYEEKTAGIGTERFNVYEDASFEWNGIQDMVKFLKNGNLLALVEQPNWVYLQENGAYGLCDYENAQGVAINGIVYNLAGNLISGNGEVDFKDIPSGEYMMQQDKVAAQNAANLDYLSMMTGYDLPMEEQAEAQTVSVGDIEGEAVYDDTVDDPAYVATEEEENANE